MENSLDPFNPTHFIEHGGFVSSDFDNDKKTDLIGYSAVRRKETYRFLTNPYPESYKFVYVPNISKGQSYYNSFLKQMNNPIESISIVNLLKDIGTSDYVLSSTSAWCVVSNKFNTNTVFFDVFSKTNSGENLEYQKVFNYPIGCIDSNGNETKPYYEYFYGDFNGDKLSDIIAVNRNNYFNIPPTPGVQQVANCTQSNTQNGAAFFIDLDKRKTNNYTNFSGNIGYSKKDVGSDVDYTKKVTILSGDVNNDGKTDLISIKNYQSNAFYSGHRSVEVFSLDENNNLVSIGITNLTHNFNKVISGDFNGDGQTDLIFDAFDGYIYTWSGNQFVFTGVKTYPLRFLNFVGDLNNDGKTDLLFYGNLSYPSHNAILTVFGYDVMMGKYKTLTNNNQIASQFLIEDDVSGNMTLVGISNSIKFTEFTNDMSKDKLVTSIKNGAVEDFITYESNENVYNISNNNDRL